jgi:UDP-N-acetyl-D-mannosaminuronic acid transferase (WecB/TagA/CpsF family)
MSHIFIDNQIDLLEDRLNAMAAAVIDGTPDVLQSVSANLQRLAVDLMQTLDGGGYAQEHTSSHVRRIRSLAAGLATVREGLLRQSAYIDRALELVVPAMQKKSTYAGSGAYGAPVRQSGAFGVLAA